MVDRVVNDWLQYIQDSWYGFNRLLILSFHSINEDIVVDTTTATNQTILLPVIDGNIAACRKQDIKFVCVQLSLDFVVLMNVNAGPMTL